MCGIAGILTDDGEKIKLVLQSMIRAMAHRGPDDEGLEVLRDGERWVGVGHRRLAIIDLSSAGHQPMQDPVRGNWVIVNGEIYNFRELRRELEGQGEVFRTQTDTEVILKAYGIWGSACLERLRGIFAFGLWDPKRRTLLLARDHLGVKPLYLWQGGGNLLFASEVRAILASDLVSRRLDPEGLISYLSYGSVQEPFTLIYGIQSLPAGHCLEWSEGLVQMKRYWRLPPPEAVRPREMKEVTEELASILRSAVGSQLIADVPLGAFLSGGIDSTAIAGLMKKAATGPVRTFSLVFDEAGYDERIYSRLAAKHIGTEHTEVLLTGEDVREALDRALDSYDQPSADGLNTWFVSRAAREAGLTVALSGVGGDELFGGYEGYSKTLWAERFGSAFGIVPFAVRSMSARLLRGIARTEAVRKAAALIETTRHPYFVMRRFFSDQQIGVLLDPQFFRGNSWQEEAFDRIEEENSGYDPVSRASAFDLQTYMRSTLLRDTDQASMAHALEVRVPLIDHRLVEVLFSLPGRMRLNSTQPKPLLTVPLKDLIPRECIYRPKRGFELPLQVWLKEILQEEVRAALAGTETKSAPFSGRSLQWLWSVFEEGSVNWSRVWAVYVIKRWLQKHGIRSFD
jgi:asparagine synthase (glutamine-hydrolysing)